MPKSTGHADYQQAMALIDKNLKDINKHSDPISWNLNTALGLLARGLQTDMAELRQRLDAIGSKR